MIPQIDNSISAEVIELISYPNLTYKCTEHQIAGKVDDLDAIKQAVHHILSIERYAYIIYDDNYGVELEKYIGQDFSFLRATIEDTLKEALTQDDRITDVQVTDIREEIIKHNMIDSTKIYNNQAEENRQLITSSVNEAKVAIVEFDVYCKQGVIRTEVKVNV